MSASGHEQSKEELRQIAAAQQEMFKGRVAAARGRDFDEAGRRLAAWLEKKVGADGRVAVSGLKYPDGAGISNETILFNADWTKAGKPVGSKLVARLHPGDHQLFLEPAFERQYRLLEVLGGEGWVRVPKVRWFEADSDVLGRPFFIMEYVAGKVPVTFPNYNTAGFLADATPRERARAWRSAMEQLAAIHRVPVDAVRFLHRPEYGSTGFEDEFAYMKRSLAWSAGEQVPPICTVALEWLEANKPAAPVDGLMWGDARIGNMMFGEDLQVAAVVDWEQASLGGNMHDLAWWLLLDELASTALGIKRLDGLGTHQETIDLWQELTGRRALDLEWYRGFAAFRCAVVSIKTYRVRNYFSPGNNTGNNIATRWLANFLDREPPPDML